MVKENVYTEQISFALSPAMKRQLKDLARAQGVRQGELLRSLILERVRERGRQLQVLPPAKAHV